MNSTTSRLALILALTCFACGNNQGNKKASTDSDTTKLSVSKENPQTPTGPQLPFAAVVIKHTVADYSKWKPVFDADSTNRKAAGLHNIGVSRGLDNQNEVEAPFMIDDVQKAKAFVSDPKLKEAMQKGGVNSTPDIKFVNVLRMSDAIQQSGDFAEIRHNVKDFDAWLKAYDGEGPATRANDGLEDGVLARGIDDQNFVLLVFRITDLEKAKAALNNPARQKLMQDAGVMGKPEIYFGRDQ
jgi:hypothetical protein